MNELNITGSARIGHMTAQWPLATLSVSKYRLELNASLLGNLVFKPADVMSIRIDNITPFKKGIKINHSVGNYKADVFFSCLENPFSLLGQIEQTGFLDTKIPIPRDKAMDIEAMQLSGVYPLRTPAIIAIVVIWNIGCLFSFYQIYKDNGKPRSFSWAAIPLAFMLLTAVLLVTAQPVRSLLLKEGRTIEHIKRAVYIMIAICTFILIGALSMSQIIK